MILLQDLDVTGKRVLLRVDFNVPFSSTGEIADLSRIKASLPSIRWILDHRGSVILLSHRGRPQGIDPQLSLAPCAAVLSSLLHLPVQTAPDCIGISTSHLQPGDILLLENLRFHPAEENPSLDPSFAKQLAALGDLYVDDAFGCAHRKHSSIWDLPRLFPGKAAAGFLLQKEIQFLSPLLHSPPRPFAALIGGAKVSTKLAVLKALAVDALYIGGGMAFTFYKALGIPVGDSLVEEDQLGNAKALLPRVHLPSHIVIADAFSDKAHYKTIPIKEGIPPGWRGMDIGLQTIAEWAPTLTQAKTLFWNGPFGVFEFSPFMQGTAAIAHLLATLPASCVVGGGDSVAAIHQLHLENAFTHLSTGGGASLEYLELGSLPGIDALS